MILLIDNYDSFVYNLKRYLVRLGQQVVVVRNDQLDLDDPAIASYDAIVISPGPRSPDDAGVCLELVRRFFERVPMLGVCLGHQTIWQALGGLIVRAKTPVHGRGSLVHFKSSALFTGIESPFMAGRYHSLVADSSLQPLGLKVTAWSEDQEIMAFEHEQWPLFGVQFHPESILTVAGYQLLHNFLKVARVANLKDVLPASDLLNIDTVTAFGRGQSASVPGVREGDSDPFAVFPGSDWRQ